MEDEEQHYVAKKEGLLSSKLLRGLFGGELHLLLFGDSMQLCWYLIGVVDIVVDTTMQCFEEVPGDSIPKEAFVCILALFYEYVEIVGG